jgi:hypothetical protein
MRLRSAPNQPKLRFSKRRPVFQAFTHDHKPTVGKPATVATRSSALR